jgi:hypothetical protein
MRWDELFADLEAQAGAWAVAERAGEVDERARMELARIRLVERMRAAIGAKIRVRCPSDVVVSGTLARVGSQWLLVDEIAGRQALVALAAVMTVTGLPRLSAAPDSMGAVESRLGLAHAVRGIARDRSGVAVDLADGSTLHGTVDRVGADFFELAVHAPGEARRPAAVREVAVVALTALAVVRRAI